MERDIEVEGVRWRVIPLPREVKRLDDDRWHLARVRFEPVDSASLLPRETWLRLEEDVPAGDVLDQYEDEQLVEACMVAEEVETETGDADAG